jgi:hypothetical protein
MPHDKVDVASVSNDAGAVGRKNSDVAGLTSCRTDGEGSDGPIGANEVRKKALGVGVGLLALRGPSRLSSPRLVAVNASRAVHKPAGHVTANADVDDGFGKGLRRFLGQIMADAALDGSVLVSARESLGIGARARGAARRSRHLPW